jgi:hypothetical protein
MAARMSESDLKGDCAWHITARCKFAPDKVKEASTYQVIQALEITLKTLG